MDKSKVCSKCKTSLDLSFFGKRTRSKDGFRSECKICRKSIKYNRKNCKRNKDKDLLYRQNTKQQKQEYDRQYYLNNKLNIINKHNEYTKNKRITDINFKLRNSISSAIYKALKLNTSSKNNNSCLQYLDYTILELKNYLENIFEPWMNWNNYGVYSVKSWNDNDQKTWKWQIDHIIPQSNFKYVSMTDINFKQCWSLSNLRPLSSKKNLLDGVSKIRHKNI